MDGQHRGGRVDVHSHFVSREMLEQIRKLGANCSSPYEDRAGVGIFVHTPERAYGPIGPAFYDLERRISYMDEIGIETQVLSPPPFTFYYWTDAADASALMRLENDGTAVATAHQSGRFMGFGTVMLQDVKGSIRELERVQKLGLVGIEIGSNVNGQSLADPALEEFYAALQEKNMPLLIHPHNVAGQERMGDYHLRNLVGFPLDTTLAAANLIFSGVLDRFPRLRICLGQAGGFLPYIVGRLDAGFEARPECRLRCERRPSSYLKHFYYDTIIHSVQSAKFLIEVVGADRVMLGSDFPFDMNAVSPVQDVEAQSWLSPEEYDAIFQVNARRFLGRDTRGAT